MNGEGVLCILCFLLLVCELINLLIIGISGYNCILHFTHYDADTNMNYYTGNRGDKKVSLWVDSFTCSDSIVRRVDILGRCFSKVKLAYHVFIFICSGMSFTITILNLLTENKFMFR